jgi:hypothetical protein
MTSTQLDFLPSAAPKPIPRPSKKTRTKKPEPEKEPVAVEVEETAQVASAKKSVYSAGYVNIKTWGVRDRAGEWVEAPGSEWRAPFAAKHLTHREALEIFDTHPQAFQLVDGCDIWACLSDEEEVFVVRKEKTNVPAAEAVPGTTAD